MSERIIAISTNEKKWIQQTIDGVTFQLKEATDFSFLQEYGIVFKVFDKNDSGNISFGVRQANGGRLFIKVAGAATCYSEVSKKESFQALQRVPTVYQDLIYPLVVPYQNFGTYQQLFYLVFNWQSGECLFDHWNFDFYAAHPEIESPQQKIKALSLKKKQRIANQLIDFLVFVEAQNYVAVDFYDGSLLYDFITDKLTICDIDLFQKKPFCNMKGFDYWGSKRFKAPEEYQVNSPINASTNVFTLGAMLFHLFGDYSVETLQQINQENQFIPLTQSAIGLNNDAYQILLRAVAKDPEQRYLSIADFKNAWSSSFNHSI